MSDVRETCSCGATCSGAADYVREWRTAHIHESRAATEPEPPPDRLADHTGYFMDAGQPIGFARPEEGFE